MFSLNTWLTFVSATVQVGSSCNQDSDCVDPAARCLYTGLDSVGSRCFCKPLYEFNNTLTVCTKGRLAIRGARAAKEHSST